MRYNIYQKNNKQNESVCIYFNIKLYRLTDFRAKINWWRQYIKDTITNIDTCTHTHTHQN